MKKIGILTLPLHTNYGGILQEEKVYSFGRIILMIKNLNKK